MPTKHSRLIDKLRRGVKERIVREREIRNLRGTEAAEMPDPKVFTAEDVLRIRSGLKMSQPGFAMMLDVSTETLKSWEDGTRRPVASASRLLQFVEKCEILTIPRARNK